MPPESDSPPALRDAIDEVALERRLARLHHHLEATGELPIDRETNRWLGEAETIAADLHANDLDRATVAERVAKVQELLAEVEETGHEEADRHLAAAKRECVDLLASDPSLE
ncbi:hypothetical protein [Halopiger goleimassiliensis]|uniref:hypothetical protein n=1 Tax=Halopiger goleimassiliensis TaxID=1293048 RepID=UPI000A3FFF96|nr:hypothetical protein [Halopiger goleimassiliensis]